MKGTLQTAYSSGKELSFSFRSADFPQPEDPTNITGWHLDIRRSMKNLSRTVSLVWTISDCSQWQKLIDVLFCYRNWPEMIKSKMIMILIKIIHIPCKNVKICHCLSWFSEKTFKIIIDCIITTELWILIYQRCKKIYINSERHCNILYYKVSHEQLFGICLSKCVCNGINVTLDKWLWQTDQS